jgi:PTS system nitrogen regulatory IIA component
MNPIAALLTADHILIDLDVATKAALFEAVGRLFAGAAGLSAAGVAASLAARERLGSTGLGQGVAIPHGRIKGLAQAQGGFVRLAHPVAFDAPDARPVTQVFVLLVPEQATEAHLQLLSELAQMFSERGFRDALAQAPDTAAVRAVFEAWPEEGGA